MIFEKEVKESPTLKLGELSRKKQQQGLNVISLALGEPDFKTPKYILDATSKALYDGYTGYSTPQGLIELRTHISNDYNNNYNSNYTNEEVIIFPGAKAAIYAALSTLLVPNDEVIIISPYYVSYPAMIKLAEPKANIIDLPLNKDFSLPIYRIKQKINNKTKALILNYPNNPTGKLLTKEQMEQVVELLINNDIYLITDELYDKLVFSNKEFVSFAKYQEIKDKLIIINGYSKTYAMTGFRIGYALSSKKIIRKMNLFNQNTNTNTNTFVQRGALSIYENDNTHIDDYNKILLERATYLHKEINSIPYLEGIKPHGGFYYFVRITKTHMDSLSFSNYLIEKHGLVTTPGISFGKHYDNYIRLSLSTDLKTLETAVNIIKSLSF